MNPREESMLADAIGDYWDALGAGGDGHDASFDPALAGAVRRTAAAGAPMPPPGYANRLWEDLMQTTVPATFPLGAPSVDHVPHRSNARSVPYAWLRRRWVAMVEVAATALILLGLLGVIANQSPEIGDRLAGFVQQDEEQTAKSFGAGGTVNIEVNANGAVTLGVYRVTVEPGAVFETPAVETTVLVISGSVVESGGNLGNDPYTLRANDATSYNAPATYRNVSGEPADLLLAAIGPNAGAVAATTGVTLDQVFLNDVKVPAGDAMYTVDLRSWAADDWEELLGGTRGLVLIDVDAGAVFVNGTGGEVSAEIADIDQQAASRPQYATGDVRLAAGDQLLLQVGARASTRADVDGATAVVVTIDPDPIEWTEQQDISSTLLGTPEAAPPAGAPLGPAEVIDPAACTITPRSADELTALSEATAVPIAQPQDGLYEHELPAGEPVDDATLAAITDVERMFTACYNAGDYIGLISTMADDAATSLLDDLAAEDGVDILTITPVALNEDEQLALFPLRNASVFEDGRVGAIVEWGGMGSGLTRVNERNFHIYEQIDGEWRLVEEIPILN